MYTKKAFEKDFDNGNGGFQVGFPGAGVVHDFNWKQLANNPSAIMFFGPPLNMSRSYDLIFKNIETLNSLHQRFVLYYNHFEGDVEACLCLYNSYLAKRMAILESDAKKKEASHKQYDGSIFTSDRAVQFCQPFDDYGALQIESVLTTCQNHSHSILCTPDMKEFIKEAPAIFGDMWTLFCELRGINETHTCHHHLAESKTNEVFF